MKFLIKTKEGVAVRTLFEILSTILDECDLEIHEDFGIMSTCVNVDKTVLVSFDLHCEKFQRFSATECKDFLTVSCLRMFEGIKTAKREDLITMSIDEQIRLTVSGKGGSATTFVNAELTEGYTVDIPEGYGRPVVVTSSEFQTCCRAFPICEVIVVHKLGGVVRMVSRTGDVRIKEVLMGECDGEELDLTFSFEPSVIRKIGSRIANLGGAVSLFFATKDKPLLIRTNVGTLGEVSFYVKPLSEDPPS